MKKYCCSFLIIMFLAGCNLLNATNYHSSRSVKRANSHIFQLENGVEKTDVSYQEIRVTNIVEFISALGSDRTILVESGYEYIFSDSDILGDKEAQKKLSKLDTLSKYYDGTYIHDVKNLTIKGTGNKPPTLFQPDGYNYVLKFRNVENVKIDNIRLGHSPGLGHCRGGVILFENSKNIKLTKLELFGSGTEGVTIIIVENFTIENSLITKCTERLSSFSYVKNANIINCKFIENEICLSGFNIYNSTIKFINSQINERYPFSLDYFKYEDPGLGEQLFKVDGFDQGSLITEFPEEFSINKSKIPISISVVKFENTKINGDLINGKMTTPNNNK